MTAPQRPASNSDARKRAEAHTAENDARRVRRLDLADTLCHKACDPYINATVRGHHLPGWGVIQLWQHYLCNAYEDAVDRVIPPGSRAS